MEISKLADKNFERLCREHRDSRIEQSKEGDIFIMPGSGGLDGIRIFKLAGQFGEWNLKFRLGVGFSSSTLFVLPNGAKRSPDLSWVKIERWNALTKEQQDKFPPLCPDFVVELRSKSDSLKVLGAKMREYVENGATLGWLIDPVKGKIHVYRQNTEVEIFDQPNEISSEPLLPKFTLKLKDFWG